MVKVVVKGYSRRQKGRRVVVHKYARTKRAKGTKRFYDKKVVRYNVIRNENGETIGLRKAKK